MSRRIQILIITCAAVAVACDNSTAPSPKVATVTITPENTVMSGGATRQLDATVRDAGGNILEGQTITWSSSNTALATVSSTGLVTAAPIDGTVTITATVGGKRTTASIGILTFVRLSVGSMFSCGLIADGTAYCWGRNDQGQLGDGTTTTRLLPTKVSTDVKFATLSAGVATTCAIAQSGFAYCWGLNNSGQLGNGTSIEKSLVPVAVSGGLGFNSIARGSETTCGVNPDSNVYCWGLIGSQIGSPNRIENAPVRIGSGMVAVVSGLDNEFCTVDDRGLAYCWSASASGEIPSAPISSTLQFTTLRVGFNHVCGLIASGQAYCWGRNDLGQLGDGTTTNRATPTLVTGGLSFEYIAAGGSYVTVNGVPGISGGYTCGITVGGKAYCWGTNLQGQLGVGSQNVSVLSPMAVAGNTLFTGMRAGSSHTCGLAVGGPAYCWGSNGSGELGDGTITPAAQPSSVFDH